MKRRVPLCSKCRHNPRRRGQRYCNKCHAAAQRKARKRRREREVIARFVMRCSGLSREGRA